MEYQAIDLQTGARVFHYGPVHGTNNIGEFLAIVHGLALQEKQGTRLPIYSDSVNAQKWIRTGICKTQLEENEQNGQKVAVPCLTVENYAITSKPENEIIYFN